MVIFELLSSKKMSETKKRKLGQPQSKTTLDRIAAVVERTEETAKSQSSKLEFLESALRETKAQITETALRAAVSVTDGNDGGSLDRSQECLKTCVQIANF